MVNEPPSVVIDRVAWAHQIIEANAELIRQHNKLCLQLHFGGPECVAKIDMTLDTLRLDTNGIL